MKLSKRLQALHSYYHNVSEVWDIGCDHGQLGLSFLAYPEIKHIHLVDPSHEVIQNLQDKVVGAYIAIAEKINIYKEKGQKIQIGNSPKCIFIAGMGGKEILEITSHLLPMLSEKDRLIVSPHRKILELREFLHLSVLGLKEEKLIFEDGQFYQILCLALDESLPKTSRFGEGIWQGREGKLYHSQQLAAFKAHKDVLSGEFVAYLEGLSH